MEKLKNISLLEKYYKLYDEKDYKNSFYSYSYNDVINHFIEIEIYNYDSVYGKIIDRDIVDKNLEKETLAISQKELKLKLIPLILFLDEEFYEKLYLEDFFEEIIKYIIEDFQMFKINIDYTKINKNSFQYENMLNLEKGLKDIDYLSTVNFVISFDIGSYQYSKFIYYLAEKMFFKEYCEILDNKDKLTFLYLLFYLEDNQDIKKRLKILNYLDKNKILLEINIFNKILLNNNYIAKIKEMIFDFSCYKFIWQNFLKFYLEYPSQNPQLFLPLANVLSKCSKDKIDIFIDTININQYFDENSKEALNNSVLTIENIEVQKYIVEKIFDRWNNFIDNYDDYMSKLFVTDIIDIIIFYVVDFLPEKTIQEEINKIILDIEEIDNKWFKDISEQQNYLYKQLSKLFVYGFGIDNHQLNEEKNKLESLLRNLEYDLKNDGSTLEEFNRYIIKNNQ